MKLSLCLILICSLAIKSQADYLTIEKKKAILDNYELIFADYDSWCRWFTDLRNDLAQYKICQIDTDNDKELRLMSCYMNKGEPYRVPKSPTDVVKGFDPGLITFVANVICEDNEFLNADSPYDVTAGDDASLAIPLIPNVKYHSHEWNANEENKQIPNEEDAKIMLQYASFLEVIKVIVTQNTDWFVDIEYI